MGKKAAVFDTETTGLKAIDGDKIIEVAILVYDIDTKKKISSYVQRINPERAIDPKAQEVHGISYAQVASCPVFKDVAADIAAEFAKADICVAHNIGFDAEFLAVEFNSAGVKLPMIPSVDTMDARWATFNGKSPNLGELCFALGVPYDPSKAHGAEYDVEVTAACFLEGLRLGFFTIPTNDIDTI